NLNQRDLLCLTRLKADGGARRDVEAFAVSFLAVKAQARVSLHEVEVAAHLDRTQVRVHHADRRRGATFVQGQRAFVDGYRADGFVFCGRKQACVRHRKEAAEQRKGQVAGFQGYGRVDGDELGAVRKCTFDMDFAHHCGDARQNLAFTEQGSADLHQLGNRVPTVTDQFQKNGRNERDGFRVVEFQPTRETALRQKASGYEGQFVDFMGR